MSIGAVKSIAQVLRDMISCSSVNTETHSCQIGSWTYATIVEWAAPKTTLQAGLTSWPSRDVSPSREVVRIRESLSLVTALTGPSSKRIKVCGLLLRLTMVSEVLRYLTRPAYPVLLNLLCMFLEGNKNSQTKIVRHIFCLVGLITADASF